MGDWLYRSDLRDPLEQLIQRENASCKCCIHLTSMWGQPWCLKTDKPAKKKCSRKKES